MSKSHVVSVRMTVEDLAKARDALISKGILLSEISTLTQIIKLTFYYGIIHLLKSEAKSPASQESTLFIQQKFDKVKT